MCMCVVDGNVVTMVCIIYTIVHAFRPKNGIKLYRQKGLQCTIMYQCVCFGLECFVAAVCVGAVMTLDLSDLYRLNSN